MLLLIQRRPRRVIGGRGGQVTGPGDDAPLSGGGRCRVELLDVDSVAQAVTAWGASSIMVSSAGSA